MGSNVLIYVIILKEKSIKITSFKSFYMYTTSQTRTTAFLAMEKDFRQTGRCNFARAKNTFGFYPSSWVIAKQSPFAEYFNKGFVN